MNAPVAKSWLLTLPLLAIFLGIVRGLPAQSAIQSQSPSLTPNAAIPTSPEELGDAYVAHQRYQAAIAAYAAVPKKTAELWNKIGIAYQMMFDSKDAMRCYKKSLKLDPRDPQVLNNLGTVYAAERDYEQAGKMYRRALKIAPNQAVTFKNLGTNWMARHKYSKGWAAYKRAIALDPRIFEDQGNLTVNGPGSVQQRGAMHYYMALGCERAGYMSCALQNLRLAIDEGFTTRKKVTTDAEFASLRANPAFKQLIAEQQRSQ